MRDGFSHELIEVNKKKSFSLWKENLTQREYGKGAPMNFEHFTFLEPN